MLKGSSSRNFLNESFFPSSFASVLAFISASAGACTDIVGRDARGSRQTAQTNDHEWLSLCMEMNERPSAHRSRYQEQWSAGGFENAAVANFHFAIR
jgi:hypothetical protein